MAFSAQIDATDLELCPKFSHYSQLDVNKSEIRLIRWFDDVEITTLPLEKAPPYHAISYHWGPATPTQPIIVQGESIQIRETIADMFDVLTELYGEQTYFWLDMLCINQHDLTERSSQVSIMALIYSSAFGVISWLGTSTLQSQIAYRIVKEELFCPPNAQARIVEQDIADILFPTSSDYKFPTEKEMESDGKLYKHFAAGVAWPAFADIFKRPYWERMWIVQEMIVGSRSILLCGCDRMDLEDLVRVCDGWMTKSQHLRYSKTQSILVPATDTEHQSVINTWRPIVMEVQYRKQYKDRTIKLMQLVDSFADRKCSNGRDKVYALRALSQKAATVKVDYSKSVLQVCLDLVQSGLLMSNRGRGFQSLAHLFTCMGFDQVSLDQGLKAAPSVMIQVDGSAIGSVKSATISSEIDSSLREGLIDDRSSAFITLVDTTGRQLIEYFYSWKGRAARFLVLSQPGDIICRVSGGEPLLLLLQPVHQDNTEVFYRARANVHSWASAASERKFTGTRTDAPVVWELVIETFNYEASHQASQFFIDSKSLSALVTHSIGNVKNYVLH